MVGPALAAVALLAPGCGRPTGSGADGTAPVGSTGARSDETTVQAVRQKLAADASLRSSDVKVRAEGGTIVLDGTAATPAAKDRAEQIVYEVQKTQGRQMGVQNALLVGK